MNAGKVPGNVADWTENMSRLDTKGSWELLDFILLDLYFLCSVCYLCFLFVFVFNRIYVTSTQQSSIQCVDSRHLGHHPPGWEERSSRWTSQIHWKNNKQYIRKYIGRTLDEFEKRFYLDIFLALPILVPSMMTPPAVPCQRSTFDQIYLRLNKV